MGELEKSLNDLQHALGRLKSFAQFKNRERVIQPKSMRYGSRNQFSGDFTHLFDDMFDYGWEIGVERNEFYISIRMKNALRKENAESEFNNIVDRMSEIRDRLSDEGFNSHFLISFDGLGQQDSDPVTHKGDLYNYKGFGDKGYINYYKDGKYSGEEYFYALIEFIII